MNLTDFSYEVLFNILLNAEPKDISNYCQTSKRASGICKDQSFWREKLWKDYGEQKQVEGMTWQEQYQFGQIKVINHSISSGNIYYGIIDEQGNLYVAGHRKVMGEGFSKNPQRVEMESKVVSVTAGYYTSYNYPFIGVVTVDGEAYIWGGEKFTLSPPTKPHKLNFPRPGKIVKMVRDDDNGRFGVIMDNGLAYLTQMVRNKTKGETRNSWLSKTLLGKLVLIQPDMGRKIVDLIIPNSGTPSINACFFLDNTGNVYFSYPSETGERKKTKLNFPDPIRQLSGSLSANMALSVKGDVYIWSDMSFVDFSFRNDHGLRGTKELPIFNFEVIESLADIIPHDIYKANIPSFIESISAGLYGAAAVTNNGTVYVWGSNAYYNLVSESEEKNLLSSGKMVILSQEIQPFVHLPLEIKLKTKIKSISIGNEFTIALTEDGILNYWGNSDMAPDDTI